VTQNAFFYQKGDATSKSLGSTGIDAEKKFGWKFFFSKKSTEESKLVFPTNLTILYPNLQKKF
jgi:hypothetical protein